MEEYFRDPGREDDHENEDVVALQAAPDGLEGADLERRHDQIFADELLPLSLEQGRILGDDRDEEVGLEHAHPRAKGVVETVPPRFDPEHDGDDGDVKKEDDV